MVEKNTPKVLHDPSDPSILIATDNYPTCTMVNITMPCTYSNICKFAMSCLENAVLECFTYIHVYTWYTELVTACTCKGAVYIIHLQS